MPIVSAFEHLRESGSSTRNFDNSEVRRGVLRTHVALAVSGLLKCNAPVSGRSLTDYNLLLLLLLLAGSGCAALIYEIVWLQLLQLVIGSSAVSLGLLLAAYMGGLCLGSAALPRLVSPDRHPLRVYAFLE